MTNNELRDAPEDSISDLGMAMFIIGYALTYNDDQLIKKIDSRILKESLVKYIKEMEIK